MQLSRERITGAALGILREYGLADVSMRRVATTLGVAPGALYWHVANKQELIATVAEAIVQPLLDGPVPDPAALSRQLRELMLGVRDGAEVVVAAVGQPDSQVRDDLERRFDEAVRLAAEGASTRDARTAARGLLHLTLGEAAVTQSTAQLAEATGAPEGGAGGANGEEHAAAVGFLLAGLERTKLWPHD